jgi:hypothetical protein
MRARQKSSTLSVYIVFASGESYDAKWASEIESSDKFDKDDKPIS